MSTTIDARGLPCPQPVILTRNALQENDEVTAIVDNETAQENVTRMAEKAGCTVQAERREDGIHLLVRKHQAKQRVLDDLQRTHQARAAQEEPASPGGPLVLVIPSEFMGRGEHGELGQVLVRGFLHTLGEVQPLPDTVIFFNSGVKLVVEGSSVLEDLRNLCDRGVSILVCGTCLGYYELKDKIAVGEVSNMYTIAETMLHAGKVVSL
jgi:selenium metabolism protein YedF